MVRLLILISEPVIDEQLVIITDKEKNRIKNISDIANKNILVFKEGCSYRKSLENLLSIYDIKTNKTMEFGTLDGILGCVAVGLGVLPYSIYEKYADDELFDYFEIPQKFGLVETVFIYRKQEYLSTNITKFIELFKTDKTLLTTPLLKKL